MVIHRIALVAVVLAGLTLSQLVPAGTFLSGALVLAAVVALVVAEALTEGVTE